MAHNIQFQCFSCHKKLEFVDKVGFREDCTHCGADVHVCRNCRFYDPSAHNECREPSAELVKEKERANYCEYFEPNTKDRGAGPEKKDLLAAAEALFKKSK